MISSLRNVLRFSGRCASVPGDLPVTDRAMLASRLLGRIAFLALALFAINATAQDSAYPSAASVLQPQAYVSLQPVPRGRSFEIAVAVADASNSSSSSSSIAVPRASNSALMGWLGG